jgi:hypothetical protein
MVAGGFHAATSDPEVIARWRARWPNHNLAIPTGRASGYVVVDIDGDDGWEFLRQHDVPASFSVKTPRGQHLYFRWPGAPVKSKRYAPELDVKGDGGYVLIPPSVVDGTGYEVDDQVPVAPMPDWLRRLVAEPPPEAREATDPDVWVRMLRDGVTEGGRNAALAALVGHLLRRYVDVDVVAELAHLVNQHRWRPPLDRREVDTVINSISRAELYRRQRSAT